MSSKKILVVDDEPGIREILSIRLAAAGFEVVLANDGQEALAKVETENPDLVILDVLMPKMTGLQFAQKLREAPKTHGLFLFVISAKTSMKEFFSGISSCEFVAKPFDTNELVSRIEKKLGKPGPSSPAGTKTLVLLGIDDFSKNKIRDFFTHAGWKVSIALNENEAYSMAQALCPSAIISQYCDPAWAGQVPGHIFDARALTQRLSNDPLLSHVPVCIYSPKGSFLEALQAYPESQLIKYDQSKELLDALANRFGISENP